jgi:hypothetical protein
LSCFSTSSPTGNERKSTLPNHAYYLRPNALDHQHIVAIGEAIKGRAQGHLVKTSEVFRVALHAAAKLALEGRLLEMTREPSPFRSKLPGVAMPSAGGSQ